MEQKNETEIYGTLLDQLGKLVVGSGVVLALAYVAGWVYSRCLYGSLSSLWLMKMIEPQGFIKEGLSWIIYCTAIAVVVFFAFRNSEGLKGFASTWMFVIGSIVSLAVFFSGVFGFNLEKIGTFNAFLAFILSLYASSALALSLRMLGERQPGLNILIVVSLGLLGTSVVFPFMQADELSRNLKIGGSAKTLVIDEKGQPLGIFVSAVGTKIVVLDCVVPYQLTLLEPTESIKLRPSTENCE